MYCPILPGYNVLPNPLRLFMVTSIILFLATFFQIQAGPGIVQSQISILKNGAPIRELLKQVEEQSQYRFFYNHNRVNVLEKVNVHIKGATVPRALDEIFRNTDIGYKISGRHILLYRRMRIRMDTVSLDAHRDIRSDLSAAVFTVSGKVTGNAGEPIPGANVVLKGSTTGTSTNAEGNYSLNIPAGSGTLIFSFIGYDTQEVPVNDRSVLDVVLKENNQALNEVVVVGYGTQKKVNLTGALSTLDMKTKENTPVTNTSQALHGVSGLWVNQTGSKPGADNATIRIRGVGTTNNSNPLVLVNGMEYDMNAVNPNDIETITVLKDASAAIYGSRAANGVILITTKTGKEGKTQINYNFSYGFQSPTRMPDVVWDPIQYMQLKNQALRNEGKTVVDYSDAQIDQYQKGIATNPYAYPNINWFDRVMRNGKLNQHHLQFSGGSDKLLYSVALGYMNQKGVLIDNDKADRYSLDLNLSAKVTKNLRIGANLIGNYRTSEEPVDGTSSYFGSLMRVLPIFTPYVQDGRYGNVVFRTPGRNSIENPMKLVKEGQRTYGVQRIFTKLFADYQLPYNLKYSINFGFDKLDSLERRFNSRVNTYEPLTLAPMTYGNPFAYNASASNLNLTIYQTLSWDHTLGKDHFISAMIGQSHNDFDRGKFSANIESTPGNSLTDINAGSLNPAVTGAVTRDRLASYFGRVNYAFREKYLLEAVLRYDGSSRFARGERWGLFPGLSAGWRIDQEGFFDLKFINLLKLRASYGKLGNQSVPLYSYLNVVALGSDYSFGNVIQPGAATTAYNDPAISWETTTNYNAGIDLEAWSGKLGMEFDIFSRKTTGILRQVAIPSQVGALEGPSRNIGAVNNSGFELSLSHRNRFNEFRYELRGGLSYVKNEVKDLKGETVISGRRILKEGAPIDAYYILHADGIYQNQEEIKNSATVSSAVKPGYLKYKDINNDGKINGDDRIVTGSSIPKWNYSFMINLSYKRLSLNTFLQGVQGISIYPTANLAYPVNNGAGLTKEWATDAWTPENTGARLPILTTPQGASENYQNSTFWLRDASYLRVQNVQLSYAFPEQMLGKAKINKLNLFVNLQNFFTFSKYKDSDPERNIKQDTLYDYPLLKTLSFGLSASF